MNIIDGYYQDKNFVESDPLPVLHIGDMISYKYGKKGKKYRVTGIKHYFWEDENGDVLHWMAVQTSGSKKWCQGNWAIKEEE